MTWQPQESGAWRAEPDRNDGPAQAVGPRALPAYWHELPGPPPRKSGRGALFGLLLAAGLCGLAVSAFGIAHQLLPRQFTVAQQRQITTWQMTRRWRAVPAGGIFRQTVRYNLPGDALNAQRGLALDAHRLGIATKTSCAAGVSAPAAAILLAHGCSAVLRATYLDSSGSLVATVAVAVLPDPAAARQAASDLTGSPDGNPALVRSLRVARTAAAGFGDAQRQLSRIAYAGPYVIMSTVGFADGRHKVRVSADLYLDQEMLSLVRGLSGSADAVLGLPPATPVCPGAPGC
ncbi:MAG: hypothetical protein ACLQFR_30630 [Streptosporangiaceae bacterium]